MKEEGPSSPPLRFRQKGGSTVPEGVNLGSIYAETGLNLQGLAEGVARAKGMVAQLDAAMKSQVQQSMQTAEANLTAVQRGLQQQLKLEMSAWRSRIALAQQSVEQQKALYAEYLAWLQAQSARAGVSPALATRINNEITRTANTLNRMAGEAARAAQQTKQSFDSVSESLAGTAMNIRRVFAIMAGFYAFTGFVHRLSDLAQTAFQAEAGLHLLEKQLQRTGQSTDEAMASLRALSEEIKVPVDVLARSSSELIRYGYNIQQIVDIFRGAAASGLLVGKSTTESIDTVTEALVSQRSVLLNYIGIVENIEPALQRYARAHDTTVEALTNAQKAEALHQMILRATATEVADMPRLFEGYGGSVADLAQQMHKLRVAAGQALIPTLSQLAQAAATAVEMLKPLASTLRLLAEGIIPVLVGVISTKLVGAIKAFVGALAVSKLNLWVFAISAIASALTYLAIKLAAAKRGGEDFASAARARAEAAQKEADRVEDLVEQYTKLSSKPSKTAAETDQLRKVMDQLAQLFPNAVKQWDEHGRVVDLDTQRLIANTQALRDNAQAQRELVEEQIRARRERLMAQLEELREQQRWLMQVQQAQDPMAVIRELPRVGLYLQRLQQWAQYEVGVPADLLKQRLANYLPTLLAGVAADIRAVEEQLKQLEPKPSPAPAPAGGTGEEQAKRDLSDFLQQFEDNIALARVGVGDLKKALAEYARVLSEIVYGHNKEFASWNERARAADKFRSVLEELAETYPEEAAKYKAAWAILEEIEARKTQVLREAIAERLELEGRAFDAERARAKQELDRRLEELGVELSRRKQIMAAVEAGRIADLKDLLPAELQLIATYEARISDITKREAEARGQAILDEYRETADKARLTIDNERLLWNNLSANLSLAIQTFEDLGLTGTQAYKEIQQEQEKLNQQLREFQREDYLREAETSIQAIKRVSTTFAEQLVALEGLRDHYLSLPDELGRDALRAVEDAIKDTQEALEQAQQEFEKTILTTNVEAYQRIGHEAAAEKLRIQAEFKERIDAARKLGQDTTWLEEELQQRLTEIDERYGLIRYLNQAKYGETPEQRKQALVEAINILRAQADRFKEAGAEYTDAWEQVASKLQDAYKQLAEIQVAEVFDPEALKQLDPAEYASALERAARGVQNLALQWQGVDWQRALGREVIGQAQQQISQLLEEAAQEAWDTAHRIYQLNRDAGIETAESMERYADDLSSRLRNLRVGSTEWATTAQRLREVLTDRARLELQALGDLTAMTGDELESAYQRLSALAGRLAERYGAEAVPAKEEIQKTLDSIDAEIKDRISAQMDRERQFQEWLVDQGLKPQEELLIRAWEDAGERLRIAQKTGKGIVEAEREVFKAWFELQKWRWDQARRFYDWQMQTDQLTASQQLAIIRQLQDGLRALYGEQAKNTQEWLDLKAEEIQATEKLHRHQLEVLRTQMEYGATTAERVRAGQQLVAMLSEDLRKIEERGEKGGEAWRNLADEIQRIYEDVAEIQVGQVFDAERLRQLGIGRILDVSKAVGELARLEVQWQGIDWERALGREVIERAHREALDLLQQMTRQTRDLTHEMYRSNLEAGLLTIKDAEEYLDSLYQQLPPFKEDPERHQQVLQRIREVMVDRVKLELKDIGDFQQMTAKELEAASERLDNLRTQLLKRFPTGPGYELALQEIDRAQADISARLDEINRERQERARQFEEWLAQQGLKSREEFLRRAWEEAGERLRIAHYTGEGIQDAEQETVRAWFDLESWRYEQQRRFYDWQVQANQLTLEQRLDAIEELKQALREIYREEAEHTQEWLDLQAERLDVINQIHDAEAARFLDSVRASDDTLQALKQEQEQVRRYLLQVQSLGIEWQKAADRVGQALEQIDARVASKVAEVRQKFYTDLWEQTATEEEIYRAELEQMVAEWLAAGIPVEDIMTRLRYLWNQWRAEHPTFWRQLGQEAAEAFLGPFYDIGTRLRTAWRETKAGPQLAQAWQDFMGTTTGQLVNNVLGTALDWLRPKVRMVLNEAREFGRWFLETTPEALGPIISALEENMVWWATGWPAVIRDTFKSGPIVDLVDKLASRLGLSSRLGLGPDEWPGNVDRFVERWRQFADRAARRLGEFGIFLGNVVAGLKGPLAELLVDLGKASPQLRRLMTALDGLIGMFARAVGAFFEPILPLVQALREILEPLALALYPVMKQLGGILASVARLLVALLGPAVKLVERILTGFLWLLQHVVVPVWNGIVRFIIFVYNVIAWVVNAIIDAINFLYPFGDLIKWRMKPVNPEEFTVPPEERPDKLPGEEGAGTQISSITGPTRDLLVELLRPLTQLNVLPVIGDEIKRLLSGILNALTGNLAAARAEAAGLAAPNMGEAAITILRATIHVAQADSVAIQANAVNIAGQTGRGLAMTAAMRLAGAV